MLWQLYVISDPGPILIATPFMKIPIMGPLPGAGSGGGTILQPVSSLAPAGFNNTFFPCVIAYAGNGFVSLWTTRPVVQREGSAAWKQAASRFGIGWRFGDDAELVFIHPGGVARDFVGIHVIGRAESRSHHSCRAHFSAFVTR